MTPRDTQPPRHDQPKPPQNISAQRIPAVLGSYDSTGKFKFHSERDRINWLRKGYRQGVNPDAFEKGTPLHPDEEAAYASGAVEAPHHVFQGPDGKLRGKNAQTAEPPEVYNARMRAWDGVRFKDVDPHAEKHLGEDEAMALMARGGRRDGPTLASPFAQKSAQARNIEPVTPQWSVQPNAPDPNVVQAFSNTLGGEVASPTLIQARFVPGGPGGFDIPTMPLPLPKGEIPLVPKPPAGSVVPSPSKPRPPASDDEPNAGALASPDAGAAAVQGGGKTTGLLADEPTNRDGYDPVYGRPPIRFWRSSPHHFSPEGAAGDALDLLVPTLSDMAKDWTELGGNQGQTTAEYRDAVDTVLVQAESWYHTRFKDAPRPSDIERMRRYIEPRLLQYFPEIAQQQIKDWQEAPDRALEIKDGAQDLTTVLRAFYYGNLVDISVDGEVVYSAQAQPTTAQNNRPGSLGNIGTVRYNQMVAEAVDKFLKECFGNDAVTHVGGGQKYDPESGIWKRLKELYVPDIDSKSTKGSKRSDVAFKIRFGDIDCIFHINTADVAGDGNSEREQINAAKMRDNFRKLALNLKDAKDRWRERFRDDLLAGQNTLLMTDKPVNGDEAALRSALEAFLKLLDCGRIDAECRASDQTSIIAP